MASKRRNNQTPLLTKNLRRRMDKGSDSISAMPSEHLFYSEKKNIKRNSKLIDGYVPSVFENTHDFSQNKVVPLSKNNGSAKVPVVSKGQENNSFFFKMYQG